MQVEITLLGGFGVTVDGSPVDGGAWRSRRATQLVALLALAPNRRLATEQVMDILWPDLTPEAARANLHKTATLARQALGSKDSVVLRGDTVNLWPSAEVTVDVVELERAARRALASGERRGCAEVARRYRGELLPDERYEEWTITRRDQLQMLYLDLLRAGALWDELVAADPTDEAAHRELMTAHVKAGRLDAAIRQFQRLRTILARELGVTPSPQTLTLYREIVGTATAGRGRPGLVGREQELLRARAALRRAAEGRPAAIFVTGRAGIGKTRLCEELVEQALDEEWFVLRATGREQTQSVPYWPLVEAIQGVMMDRPYLANALGDPERGLLARLTGLATDHESEPVHRHAVLHLVSQVVAATRASRTMLFLDDLQYVDEDTVALAEVMSSAPAPRGLVFLAASRPGIDGHGSSITSAMIARGVGVEVRLGALTRSETEAVVADALNRPPSDLELDMAWQLSDGNPFFVLELAAAFNSGHAARTTGAYGAVDTRLERLPPPVRESLRSVAVVAHQFTADEFAALSTLDADEALGYLDIAMSAGVVARQGSSYRFRHDLVRDRLTETVTEPERAAAHAAAADRLVDLGIPPARVAHHLLAAGREDDALPWLATAAREAIGVGAYADALLAAERALAINPHDPALLALRADAMNGLGDPGAPAAYSLAMAVSAGPHRASLAVRRAKALILAGDVPAATDTLATVGSVPASLLGQLEVARGLAHWCTGALDEAEQAGQRAKQLAEETGNVRDFVDATMVLAMVAHERGVWPQRVSLDLLDLHVRPDLAAVVIDAHLCVAESYLYGGVPYPEVIEFALDLQRQAAAAGSPRADAFATTLLGEAHLLMGDTGAATAHLRSAVEQHRRVGILCGEALSLQRLAQARVAEGDAEEARTALSAALLAARSSPVGTRHLLDRVHGTLIRSASDPAAAITAVDEAARAVRGPFETCPPCSINLTVPAAIACAGAGDLPRATAYLGGAEQVAAAFYPHGGWQAALDEVRAHVELAKGDVEGAVRLLRAAVEAFEQFGQRLDEVRCRQQLDAITAAEVAGKV
ncbi:MAG TPA: AAA family ATPase [Acidimicrobiales bacterium]|nr:AAA family ATPase [Acidimicrobiales bacterium]